MAEHIDARYAVQVFDGCDTLFAIKRPSGRCEALEFIGGLDKRYQARFQRYLEHLWHRYLVIELKANIYRLYLIQDDRYWFATHGTKKVSDSRVPRQITKAREIHQEWKRLNRS